MSPFNVREKNRFAEYSSLW